MKLDSVAIVEDDEKVRHYLAEQVRQHIDVRDLRVFRDGESALRELSVQPAEIGLFDVNLPGMSGIECIQKLKALHPSMQMMILTVYDNTDTIFKALQAGATSYLLKSTPPEKVVEAIQEVFNGGSPISSQIARKVIESFANNRNRNKHFQELTRREQEILESLSKGFRYKEIADHLFVSIDTVRTHIRNIYEKLQVNSRAAALRKTGFIS